MCVHSYPTNVLMKRVLNRGIEMDRGTDYDKLMTVFTPNFKILGYVWHLVST